MIPAAPTSRRSSSSRLPDLIFRSGSRLFAWVVPAALALLALQLAINGSHAFQTFGWAFVTGTTWDPVA